MYLNETSLFSVGLSSFLVRTVYIACTKGYLGVNRVFRAKMCQTKNNSKNGPFEVSLAFHSKDIE